MASIIRIPDSAWVLIVSAAVAACSDQASTSLGSDSTTEFGMSMTNATTSEGGLTSQAVTSSSSSDDSGTSQASEDASTYPDESSTSGSADVPNGPCAGYREIRDEVFAYAQSDLPPLEGVECVQGLLRLLGGERVDPIVDLESLHSLREVGGLTMSGLAVLVDVNGLAGLIVINDVLIVGYQAPGAEQCNFNAALENLDGLSNVQQIGADIEICGALQDSLVSIDGLDGALEGEFLSAIRLQQLQALESAGALAGVTRLGSLILNELPAFVDLTALSDVEDAANLFIRQTAVTDLAGLEALTTIDSRLTITDNPQLTTLAGLDALTSTDDLIISNNPLLPQAEAEAFAETVTANYVAICGNMDGPPC